MDREVVFVHLPPLVDLPEVDSRGGAVGAVNVFSLVAYFQGRKGGDSHQTVFEARRIVEVDGKQLHQSLAVVHARYPSFENVALAATQRYGLEEKFSSLYPADFLNLLGNTAQHRLGFVIKL